MIIDIISFTDEQFALLTETQIQEVKKVQAQKNKLTSALTEKKRKERFRLLKNGVLRSKIYNSICSALDRDYATTVEQLKEQLLFYLRFSSKVDVSDGESFPYIVNYSLTYEERYNIVKAYYLEKYADPTERFNAFKEDNIAPKYLGEFYATLHDYLMDMI